MRRVALDKGAASFRSLDSLFDDDGDCICLDNSSSSKNTGAVNNNNSSNNQNSNPSSSKSLLVFPAECNFSGETVDLGVVERIKARNPDLLVMVDAAKYASTSCLDLSSGGGDGGEDNADGRGSGIDFVAVSFYKIFGYPTGLGALLIHRDAAPLLRKTYFGGGTVEACLSGQVGFS